MEVPPEEPNAIGRTLGVLGDEWTLLIVRYAFAGLTRFGEWKEHLGISDAVLAERLSTLVGAGVLERRPVPGRARQEYRLARAGRDLWPVLVCIWSWERRHVPGQADLLPTMLHRSCGAVSDPVLCCRSCHHPAPLDGVDLAFGPSGSFGRSVPVGANRRRTGTRRPDQGRAGLFPETMALIGSRWSSATLGAAILGATRFTDFEQMIGAPPAVVSERLQGFVERDVLEPDEEGGASGRAGYRLTEKGKSFFPVVAVALAWGERHLAAADGPAVRARHRECSSDFVPALSCSACGEQISPRTLVVSPADVRDVRPGLDAAHRG